MPAYTYKALNSLGNMEKGTLNAPSKNEAMALLRERSIYPLHIHVTKPLSLTLKNWMRLGREGGISTKELASFTRQMATLLEATIPYDTALRMVQTESSNSVLQAVLEDVRSRVVEGAFLSDALAAYPNFFPSILVNMVRSGESGGLLPMILARLASYYENLNKLRGKIASALVYPIFMLFFSTGVVVVMSTMIIPKIKTLFDNFGAQLPLPTRIIIGFSDLLINYWWLILMLIPAAVGGLYWFLHSERGKEFMDRAELKIPVLRTFRRKVIMQRMTETLATMLNSGLELSPALEVASEVMENRVYVRAMEQVGFDIQNRGMQLNAALRRSGLFPEDICQMVAIGEETATLGPMLENVSVRLSQEVTSTLDSAMALFEPVMILLMGVGIGLIVFAVLLPMLQMNQLVGAP